ncbi:MAG: hypothetical protein H7A47_17205 [Verrucomicrobiales bacterium]|nr:hypothetical protein [Verrucomicrobiales bacterium]
MNTEQRIRTANRDHTTKTTASLRRCLALAGGTMALLIASSSAQAAVYTVNRSFTDGVDVASLTGTVEVPIGNYLIQNASVSPFTSVDLTLTVNGSPYSLTYALTDLIFGTAQFSIAATATQLVFDTANADGSNPADLVFADVADPFADNRYVIGTDGNPGFENAFGAGGVDVPVELTLPVVFGVAIPEPSAAGFAGVMLALFCGWQARRKARSGQ